jgi:hypothetical protein
MGNLHSGAQIGRNAEAAADVGGGGTNGSAAADWFWIDLLLLEGRRARSLVGGTSGTLAFCGRSIEWSLSIADRRNAGGESACLGRDSAQNIAVGRLAQW